MDVQCRMRNSAREGVGSQQSGIAFGKHLDSTRKDPMGHIERQRGPVGEAILAKLLRETNEGPTTVANVVHDEEISGARERVEPEAIEPTGRGVPVLACRYDREAAKVLSGCERPLFGSGVRADQRRVAA